MNDSSETKAIIIIDSFGGNCPVQAEGTIDGKPFYFRARGSRWSMSIGGDDVVLDPDWYLEDDYGDDAFSAGWMTEVEARAFMGKAFELYLGRKQGENPSDPR